MQFWNYIKYAALNKWNLLLTGAGLAAALISGRSDIFIPLVLALDFTVIGYLSSHPKFQQVAEASVASERREKSSAYQAYEKIWESLPQAYRLRFQRLKDECVKMRDVGTVLKSNSSPLDDMQKSDIERLLWAFLKMLYQRNALEMFLARSDTTNLEKEVANQERRLVKLKSSQNSEQKPRLVSALQDSIATSKKRLGNHLQAQENFDIITIEADRLETQIRMVGEAALSGDDFSVKGQVDEVAQSILRTQESIREIQLSTGMVDISMEEPPALLESVE